MKSPCCKKCGGELTDAVAPKSGKLLRWCRPCHAKVRRLKRSARPDYILAQMRAHRAVARAIRLGQMKRQPCVECGDLNSEAHHDDYSKPLEVVWLCRSDHRRLHQALKKAATPGTDQ